MQDIVFDDSLNTPGWRRRGDTTDDKILEEIAKKPMLTITLGEDTDNELMSPYGEKSEGMNAIGDIDSPSFSTAALRLSKIPEDQLTSA